MKTTTLCIIVCVSIAVLVVALLVQRPVKQEKEGFNTIQDISIGVGIGAGIILLIFGLFFLFYYFYPKQPNVIVDPRRGPFLNNLY